MPKIVESLWTVGVPPQTPLGELTALPRPPSCWGGGCCPSPRTPPRSRPSASIIGPLGLIGQSTLHQSSFPLRCLGVWIKQWFEYWLGLGSGLGIINGNNSYTHPFASGSCLRPLSGLTGTDNDSISPACSHTVKSHRLPMPMSKALRLTHFGKTTQLLEEEET